eukprot:TRINITY_DN4530_c0_g1_i1.p1 TRINITY_DN4530_c0_g1~~TRINITY_DN4530_c0_g1_i1.p1  ORF type:complete len:383 (+),score=93.72 TRINITY_DN4530_c0_g1_i1:43-1191(+)
MVRITEDLLRKKSEHNPDTLAELEEIALHQLEIEKIELFGHYCRHLKILLLQCNLIPRIEGLNRLKELEYLNLALNNITTIENLEGCESLKKLDLTANFVHDLRCISRLSENIHLRELYLTGNPCTKFEGYRDYVIATLPNLKILDTQDIEKSERLTALQNLPQLKRQFEAWFLENGSAVDPNYTPEKRKELYDDMETKRNEGKQQTSKITEVENFEEPSQSEEQKPFRQKNEGKWQFRFDEDDENIYLDIAIGKYLSTSLIDADVQPTFVKVTIKGKILQLLTPEEVRPDASKAERSQTTGHLLLTMPKLKVVTKAKKTVASPPTAAPTTNAKTESKSKSTELLGEGTQTTVDYRNIVKHSTDEPKVTPLVRYFSLSPYLQ